MNTQPTGFYATPDAMLAAVKADQASQSFRNRWHKTAPQNCAGANQIEAARALENSIAAVMQGEMTASEIARASQHGVPTTATALDRMVHQGRVLRRYATAKSSNRQIGYYRLADRAEMAAMTTTPNTEATI